MCKREGLQKFQLPRYEELPNFGLYLEQTITYINRVIAPLEGVSITASMIGNYVKQGYIDRPIRKQYYAEHIARLIFITINKQALSLEHIRTLFELQRMSYTSQAAYNNFCLRLESMLQYLFGECGEPVLYPDDATFEQDILQGVIVATSHIIYLNWCLEHRSEAMAARQS